MEALVVVGHWEQIEKRRVTGSDADIGGEGEGGPPAELCSGR